MKRLWAMLLAVMMLLSVLALASCGDKTDDGETGDDYVETVDPDAAALESYLETYAPEETAETYVEDLEKNI